MESIVVSLDVRTRSENNLHGHWRGHAARAKKQRELTLNSLSIKLRPSSGMRYMTVIITRISPRMLDDDNLPGATKACRDGVTDWLSGGLNLSNRIGGTNDRDPRIRWIYQQERGKPKEYAVKIDIAWEDEVPVYAVEEKYANLSLTTAVQVLAWMCLRCLEVSKTGQGKVGIPLCDHCGNPFDEFCVEAGIAKTHEAETG